MNQPSGWGSARHARHGILLWRKTVSSKKSSSGSIKTTQKKTEPVVLKDMSLSSDERRAAESVNLTGCWEAECPRLPCFGRWRSWYWQVYIVVAGVQKFIFTGDFCFVYFW